MATDSITLKPSDKGFVGDQSSVAANTRGQVGDQSSYAAQTRNTTTAYAPDKNTVKPKPTMATDSVSLPTTAGVVTQAPQNDRVYAGGTPGFYDGGNGYSLTGGSAGLNTSVGLQDATTWKDKPTREDYIQSLIGNLTLEGDQTQVHLFDRGVDNSYSNSGNTDYSLTGGGLNTPVGMGDGSRQAMPDQVENKNQWDNYWVPAGIHPDKQTAFNFTVEDFTRDFKNAQAAGAPPEFLQMMQDKMNQYVSDMTSRHNIDTSILNTLPTGNQTQEQPFNNKQDISNLYNSQASEFAQAQANGASQQELQQIAARHVYERNQMQMHQNQGLLSGAQLGGNISTGGMVSLPTYGYTANNLSGGGYTNLGTGLSGVNVQQGGILQAANPTFNIPSQTQARNPLANTITQNGRQTNMLTDEGKYGLYISPDRNDGWRFRGQIIGGDRINSHLRELRQLVLQGPERIIGEPGKRNYQQEKAWKRLAPLMNENPDWKERITQDMALTALSELSGIKPSNKSNQAYIRWFKQNFPNWEEKVAQFKQAYEQQLQQAKQQDKRGQTFDPRDILG